MSWSRFKNVSKTKTENKYFSAPRPIPGKTGETMQDRKQDQALIQIFYSPYVNLQIYAFGY
jgi:hypothetical protein